MIRNACTDLGYRIRPMWRRWRRWPPRGLGFGGGAWEGDS